MKWIHLKDEEPKANRDHSCYLCGLVIAKGQNHIYRRGVNGSNRERQFISMRMHRECVRLTRSWDDMEWVTHDPIEFRSFLGEGHAQAEAKTAPSPDLQDTHGGAGEPEGAVRQEDSSESQESQDASGGARQDVPADPQQTLH